MFCDFKAAVCGDLGDGISDINERGYLVDETVIATTTLRATLDNMSCRQRTSQRIVIISLPVEFPGGRSDHNRCIRHARTNHDVGSEIEGLFDCPGTKISIGSYNFMLAISERDLSINVDKSLALRL